MNSSNWQSIALGDLVKVEHGWPFKSEYFSEELTGKPIVINIGNFNYTGGFRFEDTTIKEYRGTYPNQYELAPRDILLVMTCQTAGGEILGIPAKVPDDGRSYLHNQRLGKIIIKQPGLVDADFLYCLFLWSEFNRELMVSASGTKILHTSPTRIEAFRFNLPPLDEQHIIAHILGSLDDKIELNRRMNATLEATARALFKSWFIDFDPVHYKARGEQPPGMDADTAALFPDSFEDSELGPIPAGWRVGTLKEIAENPRRSIQPQAVSSNTLYIGLEHMPQHSISLSDWGAATDVESNKYQFNMREFLFGKLRPYFHKVGIAPVDGICSTDILVITPIADEWWGFVLMSISDTAFIDYTTQISGGTRMPRVNWRDMAEFQIVIPERNIACSFSKFVEEAGRLIVENIHQSRTLAETRDALLPKLVSGELQVDG